MPESPFPDPEQAAREQAIREAEHIIATGDPNLPDWKAVEPLLQALASVEGVTLSLDPSDPQPPHPTQDRCEGCGGWFDTAKLAWWPGPGRPDARPWRFCPKCRCRAKKYAEEGDKVAPRDSGEAKLRTLIDGKAAGSSTALPGRKKAPLKQWQRDLVDRMRELRGSLTWSSIEEECKDPNGNRTARSTLLDWEKKADGK